MIASRRNFLAGFGSLLAAPAIVRADSLMKLHQIPERWATVWGVGWDFEVVEVPLWKPMSVAQFGGDECVGGHINKFREVTDWIYTNPPPPLAAQSNHWTERPKPKTKYFSPNLKEREMWYSDDPDDIWNSQRAMKNDLAVNGYNLHERNDDWEIEGEHQHMVDVAHNYELSTGNGDKWDYDRWAAFRDANKVTEPLPKVKFKVAVKSIV